MVRVPPRFSKNPFQDVAKNLAIPGEQQRATTIEDPGDVPGLQHRTKIYTYFTIPDGESKLLYSAQSWVKIQLTLENAGPVAVGTSETVSPVLSGKGVLLTTGREVEFTLPKGNRLFIASNTLNRVSFFVEAVPWLQSVIYNLQNNTKTISNAINALRGRR